MFQWHGWAVVRDSTCIDDASRIEDVVKKLKMELEHLRDDFGGLVDLRCANGTWMVSFAGMRNHRQKKVFALFPWLSQNAPGSYGLLFFRDDEEEEFESVFQVCCLHRGKIEQHIDTLLSPCYPMIEEIDEQCDALAEVAAFRSSLIRGLQCMARSGKSLHEMIYFVQSELELPETMVVPVLAYFCEAFSLRLTIVLPLREWVTDHDDKKIAELLTHLRQWSAANEAATF